MGKYAHDVKAAAISRVLAGEGAAAVGRDLNIPLTTVCGWVATVPKNQIAVVHQRELGELVYEYTSEALAALIAQCRKAADPAWLEKQGADGLHLLHGVMADKVIRVLAAVERARPDPGAAAGADILDSPQP